MRIYFYCLFFLLILCSQSNATDLVGTYVLTSFPNFEGEECGSATVSQGTSCTYNDAFSIANSNFDGGCYSNRGSIYCECAPPPNTTVKINWTCTLSEADACTDNKPILLDMDKTNCIGGIAYDENDCAFNCSIPQLNPNSPFPNCAENADTGKIQCFYQLDPLTNPLSPNGENAPQQSPPQCESDCQNIFSQTDSISNPLTASNGAPLSGNIDNALSEFCEKNTVDCNGLIVQEEWSNEYDPQTGQTTSSTTATNAAGETFTIETNSTIASGPDNNTVPTGTQTDSSITFYDNNGQQVGSSSYYDLDNGGRGSVAGTDGAGYIDCVEPPTCQGDPIECTSLRIEWEELCKYEKQVHDANGNIACAAGMEDCETPYNLDEKFGEETDLTEGLADVFDQQGSTGECPQDVPISISFVETKFSYQFICQTANQMHGFVVFLFSFFGARNIFNTLRSF